MVKGEKFFMSDKVSVIVPIYNSAHTLKRCVQSILAQSYKNLEVILVNDGSVDSSLSICENFKLNDERVIVINKKNAGVSSARNAGLKVASGKFVQFVDADDYVSADMTEYLVKKINENFADWVVCGYNKVSGMKNVRKIPVDFASNSLCDFENCFVELYKNAFFNAPWNKLYRRDKINACFDETLSMGEDLLFNLSYASNCDKISVVAQAYYNYDVSSQKSLSGKYSETLFATEVMLHKKVQSFFKSSFNSDDFSKINEVFAKEIYYYLKKLVVLSDEPKYEKLKKIQDCFEDDFIKNTLYDVNLSDSQVSCLCMLMKLKCKRVIYSFFKFKNFVSKSAL